MNISELFSTLNRQGIKLKLDGDDLAVTLPKSKVNPDLFKELREKKAEIITFLQNYVQVQEEFISIAPVEKKEYYPLSSAQLRLYILQQMSPDSTAYHMPSLIPIQRDFDLEKIETIFKTLIMRHESFRTSFRIVNDTTAQVVYDTVEFNLDLYELTDTRNLDDFIKRFIRPFDLSAPPLFRAALIKDTDGRFSLMVDMHHIISDGVSNNIIEKDFHALYAGESLPPLRIQYKDFSQWQNGESVKENIKRQEKYWLREFEGEIPVLELPNDFPRPAEQSFEGSSVDSEISPEETRALNAAALNGGATLFMVLAAVLNILLSKLSGREDIVIGTPIAGRRHADLEKIIGMFVNTLPLRNYPAGDRTFRDFLGEVKERTLTAFKNQEYPFEELVDKVVAGSRDMGRNPLFDVMFALQNTNTGEERQQVRTGSPDAFKNIFQPAKFDLTVTVIERAGGLFLSFLYCIKLFKEETAERFIGYFKKIVSAVIKYPGIRIDEIDILSEEERNRVLNDFNKTETEYPGHKTVHRLFEEQALRTPDAVALYMPNKIHMTYSGLNCRADLQAGLLKEKGVQPGTIAGIKMERSVEMLVGIMGILKAGGAYLPIDPDYPSERIDHMLKDSAAGILLKSEKSGDIEVIDLSAIPAQPPSHSSHSSTPRDLAYVIYTSGSTGKPKGTLIPHGNAVNILHHLEKLYPMEEGGVYLLKTNYTFDVSVTELFGWFFGGGSLSILEPGGEKDPYNILNTVEETAVTHMNFVPSMFNAFSAAITHRNINKLAGLKYIFLAGEPVPAESVRVFRQWDTNIRLENLYGPTEGTVYASGYSLSQWENRGSIPIGKPVNNVQLYICDKSNRLQPIGVLGELCISGAGVARGYLNRPELTAEKFCRGAAPSFTTPYPLPLTPLYRTGDLARWLPDGNIEFLGRIDNQVKIRGFRIELGEIENRLSKINGIKETVVLPREENGGNKYLCAYFVSDKEQGISELREFLAKELPGYMIPSQFVQLEKMPLTPNGKMDRKALRGAAAEGKNLREDVGYIPPSNKVERTLVEVWESVLGRNNIGINENFFMLGGDSIKSIQVMSRMSSAGYKFEMKHLFKYPVISDLAPHVTKLKHIADQSAVTGTVPLTPIQDSFFKESPIDRHYFNQAVMLRSVKEDGFDEEMIKAVFGKIQEHHDALRMVYKRDPETGEILQINRGTDCPLSLVTHDLRDRKDAPELLDKRVNQIQGSIDLENGPLMKLGLFRMEDGDRLLIVIHHLVIDGVSWRILFEDIETLMGQYKRQESFSLPLKTDSFKRWSEKLSQYADRNNKRLLKEKNYWAGLESNAVPPIPKDFEADKVEIRNTAVERVFLSGEETENLLTGVNHAYKTEINDILLTALGLAIKKTFGMERICAALEGHGREEILEEIEINRTVGWFTSVYPVILDIPDISFPGDTGRQIKEIKETLRRIPNKGIGYGILKYLTGEEHKKEIEFKLKPEISFNYLGQFDADVKQSALSEEGESNSFFEIAGEPAGNTRSLNHHREYSIDVTGMITNNRLYMIFSYSTKHFKQETVHALAASFQSELRRIISFCSSREETEYTPGDFTYKGLSIENVDRLTGEYPGIEDLYALTPMQEGMLYHALIDKSSLSNFEQTSYRLEGELDISLVERSLNELSRRHDLLRSAFVYKDIESPVQVVLKERVIDFYYEDISNGMEHGEKENIIIEFKAKNKERGFDLSKDALMRVSILRMDNSEYELTWSFHHILMDGWCLGILNREFFELYNSYKENRPYRLPVLTPYRSYIQWLGDRDREESGRYWATYLESFAEQTGVPKMKITSKSDRQVKYRNEAVTVTLDTEKVSRLNRTAMENHVTVNTVMQVVWGILLGKYNRKEDVVFGVVVSGRPPELEGVESMVGLFMNNIPLRIRFDENMRFDRLIQKIQEEAVAAESHHYYPLVEIQALSMLKQNLFNHLFIFENYPVEKQIEENRTGGDGRDGLQLLNVDVFEQINYDFNVMVSVLGEMGIQFRYNGNFYAREFVEQIGNHLITLLDRVIEDVEVEVGKSDYLSSAEKQRLLHEFNDTEADYPKDKTLHELFKEQAEQNPDRIAVTHLLMQISYRELDTISDGLAVSLKETGVGPGTIAAIVTERTTESVIDILAILKTGGACLPIAGNWPPERVDFMLKDSGGVLLSRETGNPGGWKYRVVRSVEKPGAGNPGNREGVSPPAYVIYHWDPSGLPKGILLGHGSIISHVYGFSRVIYDRYPNPLKVASTDPFVFESVGHQIFTVLLTGQNLCIVPKKTALKNKTLIYFLREYGIDISDKLPAPSPPLSEAVWKETGVKHFVLRETTLPAPLVEDFLKSSGPGLPKITILYSTGECCTGNIQEIPICRPMPNYNIHIVGMYGELQPVGGTGELVIGGAGLGTGYLSRPGLSRGAALSSITPYPLPLTPFYRTGNLARRFPDGNIEFIGRVDKRVKTRVRRTKPGEIESRSSNTGNVYFPPSTETEKKIAGIWEDILERERVSIHDDFFESGGNSLTTIRLTSRIKELGFNISLSDVIENPTIHMISSMIGEENTRERSAGDVYEENVLAKLECIEKLNKGRNGKNIFIIHPANGMVSQYKPLAELLEQDYSVYGIQARGLKPGTKMPDSPGQMVDDYLAQILAVQGRGPYIIGGYCSGVSVAYEIVIRLERLKQPVEKLILFNSAAYFTGPLTRKIGRLERLPRFMRKWTLSFVDRECKKAIKAEKFIEGDDDSLRENVERHLVILNGHFLPSKIVNTPILVPLVEKEFGPGADEAAFRKMTRGKPSVIPVPGDHNTIWQPPFVETLAEVVRNNLSNGCVKNTSKNGE